ncbi:hypothetical protein GPX89_00585 [Nocardia sp. ET3-3]|uniref:Uncharacterized protein n=1 Tax=Nocardia terrae TaxID=2675851 RepID=A0A7K1UN23_9NOCA|nr:hypothetical protein [Nocardia terrae]MVU75737.1 hypothetical protein [Nocardia terrae]
MTLFKVCTGIHGYRPGRGGAGSRSVDPGRFAVGRICAAVGPVASLSAWAGDHRDVRAGALPGCDVPGDFHALPAASVQRRTSIRIGGGR